MNYWVGVDPGKTGGLAVVDHNGKYQYSTQFTDWKTHGNTLKTLMSHTDNDIASTVLVAIEKVGAMPRQGVSSMFTFGANFGGWISLLEYLSIPYILVPPIRWQKQILGSFPKGESKERAFKYISSRYPELNIKKSHSGIIDALCLALYIRDYN